MAADKPDNGDGRRTSDNEGDGGPSRLSLWLKKPWVKVGLVVLAVLVVAAGIVWWLIARQYESTDDAFVDTHIVNVAPQVAGRVIAVAVRENQTVHAGQLLVELDPAPYRAKLAQALAQKQQAQTQLQQMRDSVRVASAQLIEAERTLARYRGIQRTDAAAISRQQVDQAVAAVRTARAQRDAARDQVQGARAQIKVLDAQIATARLDVGYTRIAAPQAGHIAQRSVAVGNYVSAGENLMAIVPLKLWITANFKETQLEHMRPGQSVTVSLDSCGDADVHGHVDSIQRGAGQAFQILPPENATGNFVKVVQRVPVKILIDKIPKGCTLGPGMSVQPEVKVR